MASDCIDVDYYNIPSGLNKISERQFVNTKCKIVGDGHGTCNYRIIEKEAFLNSTFEEFTFPSSLETIEERAFANCTKLQKITFKSSKINISNTAFVNCNSLNTIIIPIGTQKVFESIIQSKNCQIIEHLYCENIPSKDILYHFTKFDNAIKILLSKRLKFSKAHNTNDINEIYRANQLLNIDDEKLFAPNAQLKKELEMYRQISFSIYKYGIPPFLNSSMWGHYADNANGICLIFNKRKLLESIQNKYKKPRFKSIKYTKNSIQKMKNIDQRDYRPTNRNINDIFFSKDKDWKYEQEYRVLIKLQESSESDKEYFVDIADSLVGVIQCRQKFDNLRNLLDDNIELLYYTLFEASADLINQDKCSYWSTISSDDIFDKISK